MTLACRSIRPHNYESTRLVTETGSSGSYWRIAGYSAGILLVTIVALTTFQTDDSEPDSAPETVKNSASDGGGTPIVETPDRPYDHDLFVGSGQCASCHSEISAAYEKHPMANSISRVTGLPKGSEDASRIVPGIQRRYEVVMQDGEMFHRDEMFDAQGQSIFDQSVRMDYVVGSGRRAFAYMTQQGELMFQSPLNWYAQDSKWDLSPGYRVDDVRRFRRRISDDCLSCHAGLVAAVENSANRYQQSAFSEMSIGCEKCHGPGKPHIEFHMSKSESGSESGGAPDPIVNPGRLEIVARESVCNQCHLQSAARIPRYGRSEFDFRPGQKFEEIWTAFDAGTDVSGDGKTRAVNHVQQMRDSRCYVASEAKLGCVSCHDPHRLPAEEEKDHFFRQQCMKCHTAETCTEAMPKRIERDDSCIDCHMPHRDSNNISHVTQTDHRILRRPEESANNNGKGRIQLRFFDDAQTRMPEWEKNRAMGVAIWSYLMKKGQQSPSDLTSLLEPALGAHSDDGLVLTTLGAFAIQQGRTEMAVKYLTKAQKIPAAEEVAVAGLLDIFYQQGHWEKSFEYVDRCIELDPGHPGYHAIRADILKNSGRLKEGILEAEQSVALDPTILPVRSWLANAYEKDGRDSDALAMREIVRRMQTAKVPE